MGEVMVDMLAKNGKESQNPLLFSFYRYSLCFLLATEEIGTKKLGFPKAVLFILIMFFI